MIEIICSGIGGQGVLVAGMVLADIAMEDGKNVSWYPSYGFEMRGGAANCEVKIGDEDLQSPYCYEPDILLTMSESAIDTFEERLKPGGVLLVNSSLVDPDRTYRDDIKVIKAPVTQMAIDIKNERALNVIMLGVYVGATDAVPEEVIVKGIEHKFAAKPKLIEPNVEAFRMGLKIGREQK